MASPTTIVAWCDNFWN